MRDENFEGPSHPGDGVWRAYLDGELPLPRRLRLRRHALHCAECQARLDDVGAAGDRASQLLRNLEPATDVAESWERFGAVTGGLAPRRSSWAPAFLAGGLSAAALAASVLLLHPAPTRLLGRVHGVGAFTNVLDECCYASDATNREGIFTLELPGVGTPLQVRYLEADGSGTFSSGDVVRAVTQIRKR